MLITADPAPGSWGAAAYAKAKGFPGFVPLFFLVAANAASEKLFSVIYFAATSALAGSFAGFLLPAAASGAKGKLWPVVFVPAKATGVFFFVPGINCSP